MRYFMTKQAKTPFLLVITVCLPILKGGEHLFHLIDFYGVDVITLFFIACFESICIAWVSLSH